MVGCDPTLVLVVYLFVLVWPSVLLLLLLLAVVRRCWISPRRSIGRCSAGIEQRRDAHRWLRRRRHVHVVFVHGRVRWRDAPRRRRDSGWQGLARDLGRKGLLAIRGLDMVPRPLCRFHGSQLLNSINLSMGEGKEGGGEEREAETPAPSRGDYFPNVLRWRRIQGEEGQGVAFSPLALCRRTALTKEHDLFFF